MNDGDSCYDKWEKEVEGEEAGEGGMVDGEASSDSLD